MNLRRLVRALVAVSTPLAFGVGLDACNSETVEAPLRSLQASSELTFVCHGQVTNAKGEAIKLDEGFPPSDCPDFSGGRERATYALVTQTATNEVAIINVDQHAVIDLDLVVPGYSFLRLPSRPGDIVSTPGGRSAFVGLVSTGKTGIAALPTTCLGPPRDAFVNPDDPDEYVPRQHARDVTTFPACSLPSAPGDMAVVVEPPGAGGVIAETCADPLTPERTDPPGALWYKRADGQDGICKDTEADCKVFARDCTANLATEGGPKGRRKLVVTLPDAGEVVVIDAQALLDRHPGSFEPCPVEATLALASAPDASGQRQDPPAELDEAAARGCMIAQPTPPPVSPSAVSRPSGLAVADNRLFIGDLHVSAVHVVDATSVCGLKELPSLLPMSFSSPWRTVTTSRVAVSPVTPSGKQFVYAVDYTDQPTTSVMAFDVSDGSTNRTPIVRAGSVRQPREAPDRIAFAAPVADIAFAYRDLPKADPVTGVAELGIQCDPDPNASVDPPTPGVQSRSTSDYTQGARPILLRGLFGLVMLTSGQIVVIDVEDFDAACRRPVTTNQSLTTPDFRGCLADPPEYGELLKTEGTGSRTVTDEVSCNMVEPHRPRSANFGISNSTMGLGAPSLRGYPQFTFPLSIVNLAVDDRPKLVGVPFKAPDGSAVDAPLNVGTASIENGKGDISADPSAEDVRSWVALPFVEPRSYPSNDHSVLTYEGRVFPGDLPAGFIDTSGVDADGEPLWTLKDDTAYFCSKGVYDEAQMQKYGETELGIAAGDAASSFARAHTDYVQITGDFPSVLDTYWASERAPEHGRDDCLAIFGPPPRPGATELLTTRDLVVREAFQGQVMVRPRDTGALTVDVYADLLTRCFPSGIRYSLRGQNQWVLSTTRPDLSHDIIADPSDGYRCVRDCDPRKRWSRSRVFEIARGGACEAAEELCSLPTVGYDGGDAAPAVCHYDPLVIDKETKAGSTRGIGLDEPAASCIFENLTSRFAVYRGLTPSVRDMTFTWDTTGGFAPLAASLASLSSAVLPQHLTYMPEYQAIAVVDAASLGLSLMSLDSLRVNEPWPVY